MSLESRARQAKYELEITEEAHAKLRAHLLEEAVRLAGAGDERGALLQLLQAHAMDNVRTMLLTPIQDHEYEAEAAKRRQASGQAN